MKIFKLNNCSQMPVLWGGGRYVHPYYITHHNIHDELYYTDIVNVSGRERIIESPYLVTKFPRLHSSMAILQFA